MPFLSTIIALILPLPLTLLTISRIMAEFLTIITPHPLVTILLVLVRITFRTISRNMAILSTPIAFNVFFITRLLVILFGTVSPVMSHLSAVKTRTFILIHL